MPASAADLAIWLVTCGLNINSTLGGVVLKINDPLATDGIMSTNYSVTLDNKAAIYIADQDTAEKDELHVSYLGCAVYLPVLNK